MYCELTVKWGEVKECETFVRKWREGQIEIIRVIPDYTARKIYEASEIIGATDKLKEKVKDDEYVTYNLKHSYGPYRTKNSIKTALSKIKSKLRHYDANNLVN